VEFNDPSKVAILVDSLQVADVVRAKNRAKINATFNGLPPYTDAEVDQGQIDTNVNFLQGARITSDARGKLYSAMFGDSELFSVTLTKGEPEFRDGWQLSITNELNEIIRGNLMVDGFFESVQVIDGPLKKTRRKVISLEFWLGNQSHHSHLFNHLHGDDLRNNLSVDVQTERGQPFPF
jgi:hypothetical protein